MQAVLVVEQGRLRGQRRWIQCNEQLSVGGSAWADFVVDEDANLSPMHFMISLSDEGCLLHGLNESATFVNGKETVEAWLQNGDRVQAGKLEFVIQLNGLAGDPVRRRVDLEHANPFAPVARAALSQSAVVKQRELDGRFVVFEPTSDVVDSGDLAQRVAARMPLYLLCRFDRWSFPIPPELERCQDCVPATADRQAMRYLPLLFRSTEVQDAFQLIGSGLDAGCLMAIATPLEKRELLRFLRGAGGLFLSPQAMQNVLMATTEMGAAFILGPLAGALLGSNSKWSFYADQHEFPDACALGFASNHRQSA